MWPEIIKEEVKSEKVQHILWRDLKAVSFEEIHSGTEATTPTEKTRVRMNETIPEHQNVSYKHKKFGNVYDKMKEEK